MQIERRTIEIPEYGTPITCYAKPVQDSGNGIVWLMIVGTGRRKWVHRETYLDALTAANLTPEDVR
jgi:hypothetical protein